MLVLGIFLLLIFANSIVARQLEKSVLTGPLGETLTGSRSDAVLTVLE
jgi:hypothetical protein